VILLDTCTLLWLSTDPPRLPAPVIAAIRQTPPGQRYLSAITAYEIGVKHARGRLVLPAPPRAWLEESCAERGLSILPVTRSIALLATELPWHHRDPADRMIIATAIDAGLPVLTPDPAFEAYKGVTLVWDRKPRRRPRRRVT